MNKKYLSVAAMAFAACAAHATQTSAKAMPDAPGRYIVQLKDSLPELAVDKRDQRIRDKKGIGAMPHSVLAHLQRLEKRLNFKAHQGFGTAVKGFSAILTGSQLKEILADPTVARVEVDAPIKGLAQTLPYGIQNVGATDSPVVLAGDGLDNANFNGVRVFVIDSGVADLLALNVVERVNYVGDGYDYDCNGHGTHVAGTIGARDDDNLVVGVAPGVAMSSLKVLDCSKNGYASSLIKAFDYAASQAIAMPGTKFVANVSIGLPAGTVIATLDNALLNAVSAGVTVAVAAGNSANDTCATSLTRLSSSEEPRGVIAVGAVDSLGSEASFSSFGTCVATWAPGVSVLSTSKDGTVVSMNGTSMAAPHVAGAAAAILAHNPSLTPAQVDSAIKARSLALTTVSKDGRPIQHVNIGSLGVDDQPAKSVASVLNPTADFGTVKLKAKALPLSVGIKNTGNVSMTLTGLAGLPGAVKLTGSTCTKVAPGANCALTLELTTTKKVSFSSTVTTLGANQNSSFVVKGVVN